ncbi:centrosomal protein of [Danaus plexippus plexippus]|uniref:Centrosomal protein of n=1 Tax=Danaus plexippus plexippus TaxID=278856 RepID=A0A212ENR9_DANPL|nr:centrosomal protein of [Danaus plexippus plexippus]
MGDVYFDLKRKLEDLGYTNTLSLDSVPLVQCIVADLLQTTRSLQHYMDLSKEALMQRDALMIEAEPYKCDNIKLIQENNQLHKEIMLVKEEHLKITKESRRKIKNLTDELSKKEALISKLQHDIRDLSLRGLCAETQSSRNKSKRKDGGDCLTSKVCICHDTNTYEKDAMEKNRTIQSLEEKLAEYSDEITLLQNQVEQRDNEIVRLSILLDGGRPVTAVSKDFYNEQPNIKLQNLTKQMKELERANESLKKEVASSLEKQHEAMLRALSLADKNKKLQEEVQQVDKLALKLEDDCNKRLASMMNEMNFLQTRLDGLSMKNSELEKEASQRYSKDSSTHTQKLQENLAAALMEKEVLHKEIKDLVDLNKSLQEKIVSLTEVNRNFNSNVTPEIVEDTPHLVKEELKELLQEERRKYETYIVSLEEKLSETINLFNKHASREKDLIPASSSLSCDNSFIRDLHNKLCKSEQQILMLKKENDELQTKIYNTEEGSKHNYKDIIKQLNDENTELSKENISLSRQVSQYKSLNTNDRGDYCRKDLQKLNEKIDDMSREIQVLKKDKQEYHMRYKEAMELADKLKRDLAYKVKEMEHLEEENCSYKMSHRTGQASADHLKEECNYLREQMKKMQSDYIKEKTLANQIKNIQLETERSSAEAHNELLSLQKKLSLLKDSNETLENKCRDLQSEIIKLRNDNMNLVDNIKLIDKERDKLVIELDQKTENISVYLVFELSVSYELSKLENELSDAKRKLNMNKVSEHKVVDYESQITFLNGEILRLTQQLDTSVMENKHLQNSLADANGHLKITRIELEKSKKDVDGLKQQLQHYVAEIRRIEELLSQKEAERSDMLEHFASLSVEANILENTNHSLESESASKSMQLQSYVSKIQNLEEKLVDKEHIIDSQSARIAAMTCKISSLENEIKLMTEEKNILEQNVSCLKQMCNNLQSNKMPKSDDNSEIKLYENRIRNLSSVKTQLESEKEDLKEKLRTTERLLSNTRRECIELKLALQDATSETKSLQEHVSRLRTADDEQNVLATAELNLNLPLMLEETIHELSHEDEYSDRCNSNLNKSFTKYTHSSTL